MPLLVKRPSAPVVPPSPGFNPDRLGVTYIDPDGHAWAWGDLTAKVFATAVAGLGSPPVAFTQLGLPSGGAFAQSHLAAARTITVGLYAYDDEDQEAFLALVDRLAKALWSQRAGKPAPGILVIARPDGTARQIKVYCTDGMDLSDDDRTKSGLMWATYPVTLAAPDPFFEDADATSREFGSSTAAGVPPMPPIVLAPSSLLGDTSVDNSGDADAYPVWTIHGPGTPTLTNTTTGRSFGLDVSLGDDEVVVVDTRPGMQSAVDQDSVNRWADLVRSSPRDLWQLIPGVNDLNLSIGDSGAGSKISLSFTRRWLRA